MPCLLSLLFMSLALDCLSLTLGRGASDLLLQESWSQAAHLGVWVQWGDDGWVIWSRVGTPRCCLVADLSQEEIGNM